MESPGRELDRERLFPAEQGISALRWPPAERCPTILEHNGHDGVIQGCAVPALQFRRKPAVTGERRPGMIGLDRVGQGFMQQTTSLAQRATASLALHAERQLHVFQEREEAEALLAADDHAVTIGEQAVAGRPGAAVQFLVALTLQFDGPCLRRQHRERDGRGRPHFTAASRNVWLIRATWIRIWVRIESAGVPWQRRSIPS